MCYTESRLIPTLFIVMPRGVYQRSSKNLEQMTKRIKKIRPPIESLKEHYESIKGDGNPSKRPEVREKIRQFRTGFVVSEETKKKISKTRTERYCSSEKRTMTAKDKEWRLAVYARDNYHCVLCNAVGVKLNADHIKGVAEHPELRLELSNGRTLCVPCHLKTPNYGMRGKKMRPRSV